jgi:hypothetical protein
MKLGGECRILMAVDFFSRGCYLGKISKTLSLFNNLTRRLYIFQYHPKSRYYCFSNFSAAIFMDMSFHFEVEVIAEKE